jgi:hypothetical protein
MATDRNQLLELALVADPPHPQLGGEHLLAGGECGEERLSGLGDLGVEVAHAAWFAAGCDSPKPAAEMQSLPMFRSPGSGGRVHHVIGIRLS